MDRGRTPAATRLSRIGRQRARSPEPNRRLGFNNVSDEEGVVVADTSDDDEVVSTTTKGSKKRGPEDSLESRRSAKKKEKKSKKESPAGTYISHKTYGKYINHRLRMM